MKNPVHTPSRSVGVPVLREDHLEDRIVEGLLRHLSFRPPDRVQKGKSYKSEKYGLEFRPLLTLSARIGGWSRGDPIYGSDHGFRVARTRK